MGRRQPTPPSCRRSSVPRRRSTAPCRPGIRLAPDYDDGSPQTKITKGPKGTVSKRSVEFDWQWSDVGSTLECRMDDVSYEPCVGPKEFNGLNDGKHTFRVRAVDPELNADPTPAKRTFGVNA